MKRCAGLSINRKKNHTKLTQLSVLYLSSPHIFIIICSIILPWLADSSGESLSSSSPGNCSNADLWLTKPCLVPGVDDVTHHSNLTQTPLLLFLAISCRSYLLYCGVGSTRVANTVISLFAIRNELWQTRPFMNISGVPTTVAVPTYSTWYHEHVNWCWYCNLTLMTL